MSTKNLQHADPVLIQPADPIAGEDVQVTVPTAQTVARDVALGMYTSATLSLIAVTARGATAKIQSLGDEVRAWLNAVSATPEMFDGVTPNTPRHEAVMTNRKLYTLSRCELLMTAWNDPKYVADMADLPWKPSIGKGGEYLGQFVNVGMFELSENAQDGTKRLSVNNYGRNVFSAALQWLEASPTEALEALTTAEAGRILQKWMNARDFRAKVAQILSKEEAADAPSNGPVETPPELGGLALELANAVDSYKKAIILFDETCEIEDGDTDFLEAIRWVHAETKILLDGVAAAK